MTTIGSSHEPLPEPDLASGSRARHASRLVEVARELDQVADVAAGKLETSEVTLSWLRVLAAPRHGELPAMLIVEWLGLFADDLELVWRARNNVLFSSYLSDGNMVAASEMAERILALAKDAASAMASQESAPSVAPPRSVR